MRVLFKNISNIQAMQMQSRDASLNKTKNNGLTGDSVNFGNDLTSELINFAKTAKKIRFEQLTPSNTKIFMKDDAYSIRKVVNDTSSTYLIKKMPLGKDSNTTINYVNKEVYESLLKELKEIVIPKILQRKGFQSNNLSELLQELAQKINNNKDGISKKIVLNAKSRKIQQNRFELKNSPRNAAVNYVSVSHTDPQIPPLFKLKLVDKNGYNNSFFVEAPPVE